MITALIFTFVVGGTSLPGFQFDYGTEEACQKASEEVVFKGTGSYLQMECKPQFAEGEDRPFERYVLHSTFFNGYFVEADLRINVFDSKAHCEKALEEINQAMKSSRNPNIQFCFPE